MTQNRDKGGGLRHGRPEPTRGEERDGCGAGHSHPGIQPAAEPLNDADWHLTVQPRKGAKILQMCYYAVSAAWL